MSIEVGALVAMTIGILGGAMLTTWCLFSRHQEKKQIQRQKSLSK